MKFMDNNCHAGMGASAGPDKTAFIKEDGEQYNLVSIGGEDFKVCAMSPLDTWSGAQTGVDFLSGGQSRRERSRRLGFMLNAYYAAKISGLESDRGGPLVHVTGHVGVIEHGGGQDDGHMDLVFLFKQINNGTTFAVIPVCYINDLS